MGTKQDYERKKADKKSQNYRGEPLTGLGKNTFRHPDRMIRFTWWVAVFTFCLACVGFIQVWAFIQSERAFVAASAFQFADNGPLANIPLVLNIVK